MYRSNVFALKGRIILSLSLMLLPTLGMVIIFYLCFHNHTLVIEQMIHEFINEKKPVLRTELLVQQALSPLIIYSLTGDQSEQIRYKNLVTDIDESFLQCLKEKFHQPKEEEHLTQTFLIWEKFKKNADSLFLLNTINNNTEKVQIITNKIELLHLEILKHFSLFHEINDRELVKYSQELTDNKTLFTIAILSIISLGLILSMIGGFILSSLLLTPLQKLYLGARQLAAGNIAHRIENHRNDELGLLIHTFNWMANELQKTQEKLHSLATSDPLTGLSNHRNFFQTLEKELDRSQRYQHKLSVLMMDMNDFKIINDTMGHLAGDHVLKNVGKMLQQYTRKSDLVCRYGGDEFSILLPETQYEEALEFSKRLSEHIKNHSIKIPEQENSINISISIGVATFPQHGADHMKLMSAADKALYEVKRTKNNKQ
ncbi:MAG: diguanylate cyclase [Desulfobulbaceae bacterium]|nr:diguanylate cyclase [Desulfobulbaceae bacterium]